MNRTIVFCLFFVLAAMPAWACIGLENERPTLKPNKSAGESLHALWQTQPGLVDRDGMAMPLNDQQLLEAMLIKSRVTKKKVLDSGITKPLRLDLDYEGRRFRGVFRHVHSTKERLKLKGELHRFFQDSYKLELAAYQVAQTLAIGHVPPVVARGIEGRDGSLQLWVENAVTEQKRRKDNLDFPEGFDHYKNKQHMLAFDLLIYNFDRHEGNFLYDENWYVWYIDHSRSFKVDSGLPNVERLHIVERKFWNKLQSVSKKELNKRLRGHLNPMQLAAFHKRRENLISYISTLIEERGESQVLYDWN
ncbi:hypothetical protein [Acanthopleuribacter pedis]|uniref:PI3K/PI4K catalytic domain-containing protein n=1 Tax=Acanthopleuribacter pedis TaxID=442870 RepID=A0A8J7U845_9BACT|nr:hypothetical protein [Acanthopleuribacter pedis]MBO1323188.1 hypothetical protein [Acanthopleuribacter pedis]